MRRVAPGWQAMPERVSDFAGLRALFINCTLQ
jgi:hypothetical protein